MVKMGIGWRRLEFLLAVSLAAVCQISCVIKPGFPCEKIPNFCDRVVCLPPEDCPNGILINGGGNCGCCKICVTFAELGEDCTDDGPDPIVIDEDFVGLYYRFNSTCRPGMVCNSNICDNSKDCFVQQEAYKTNTWEVRPDCDFYGNYEPLRYKGRDTPRTFCNDEDGGTIFGRITTGAVNVTCECSRLLNDLDKEGNQLSFNIRCDEMGDFTDLQCWKGICFCVDPQTKIMTSSAVPISAIKALPCFNGTLYNESFYTGCQNESMKMNGLIEELSIKGVSGIMIQLPVCDADGSYAAVQNDGSHEFCADRAGNQIGSYVNYNSQTADVTMDCNCARDGNYPDGLPNSYRFTDCNTYGSYNPSYVVWDTYYCLDSDGQQSSDEGYVADGIPCG